MYLVVVDDDDWKIIRDIMKKDLVAGRTKARLRLEIDPKSQLSRAIHPFCLTTVMWLTFQFASLLVTI